MTQNPKDDQKRTGGVYRLFTEAIEATPVVMDVPEWVSSADFPYGVEKYVGRGGHGLVWKVYSKEDHAPIALKIIPFDLNDAVEKERWVREGRMIAEVDHPNLVKVINQGLSPEGDAGWIALAWVDGSTLGELIQREGPFSWDRFRAFFKQVADGLIQLHASGIVHRDIKPNNIMVDTESGKVTILDFGIAAMAAEERLTRTHESLITPGYSSPEQSVVGGGIDPRSDQFSLAVTSWQLLSGQVPAGSFGSLKSDAPAHVEKVLRRAMDPEPEQRFATLSEFRETLFKKQFRYLRFVTVFMICVLVLGLGFWMTRSEALDEETIPAAQSTFYSVNDLAVECHEEAHLSCRICLRPEDVMEGVLEIRNDSRFFGVTVTLLIIFYDENDRPIFALNGGHYGLDPNFFLGGLSERTDFFHAASLPNLARRVKRVTFNAYSTNADGRVAYTKRARQLQKELAENQGAFYECRRSSRVFDWWSEEGLIRKGSYIVPAE